MTDTLQWPITSDSSDKPVAVAFPGEWFPSDPLDYPIIPRLIHPAPLVDKALLDQDNDKGEL